MPCTRIPSQITLLAKKCFKDPVLHSDAYPEYYHWSIFGNAWNKHTLHVCCFIGTVYLHRLQVHALCIAILGSAVVTGAQAGMPKVAQSSEWEPGASN